MSRGLEPTLVTMLDRVIERGGRACVRGTSPERLEALDRRLWTQPEDGFRPHGRDGDPAPARQPIWLTTRAEVPNGAGTLFLIDSAEASEAEMEAHAMTAVVFEGTEGPGVDQARAAWRRVVAAGLKAVYWAESSNGWEKKAEAGG